MQEATQRSNYDKNAPTFSTKTQVQDVSLNEQLDQLKARFNQNSFYPPKLVIHRTAERIVVANPQERKKIKSRQMQKRGWNSPFGQQYRPYGEIQQVVNFVEEIKQQIGSTNSFQAETLKTMGKLRRDQKDIHRDGSEPLRSWDILVRGVHSMKKPWQVGDEKVQKKKLPQGVLIDPLEKRFDLQEISLADGSASIMQRMINIEGQFMTAVKNGQVDQKQVEEERELQRNEKISEYEKFSVQRLMTPNLQRLIQSQDHSLQLRDQVNDSVLRLKAAKRGQHINKVVPNHPNSYFLPNRDKYSEPLTLNQQHKLDKHVSIVQKTQRSQNVTQPVSNMREDSIFLTEDLRGGNTRNRKIMQSVIGVNQNNDSLLDALDTTSFGGVKLRPNKLHLSMDFKRPNENENLKPSEKENIRKSQHKIQQILQKFQPRRPAFFNELSSSLRGSQESVNDDIDSTIQSPQKSLNISSLNSRPMNPSFVELKSLHEKIKEHRKVDQFKLNINPMSTRFANAKNENMQIDTFNQEISLDFQTSQYRKLQADLDQHYHEWVTVPTQRYITERKEEEAFAYQRRQRLLQEAKEREDEMDAQQLQHLSAPQIDIAKELQEKFKIAAKIPDLDENQELLLQKIIALEGITLDGENDEIKTRLYELFFDWTSRESKYDPIYQKKVREKIKIKRDTETEKIQQLQLDQEILEFEERGGFKKVIEDLFNPNSKSGLQLDSVYQLKAMIKEFYQRKQERQTSLIHTLDALNNQRPQVMQIKRQNAHKSFTDSVIGRKELIEKIRMNTEKEMINRYKGILEGPAKKYYSLVDEFANLIKNFEGQYEQLNGLSLKKQRQKIERTLMYVSDYIKQVIENGNEFTINHFFILMLQLQPEEIQISYETNVEYIQLLVKALGVKPEDFEKFISGIQGNNELKEILANNFEKFF